MKNLYAIGIDLGTSSVKIAILNTTGEIVDSQLEEYNLIFTDDGGVEQNPEDWWNAIKTAFKKLKTKINDSIWNKIELISITTQWSGTVCVDENGLPIGNAIIWMDSRGSSDIQNLLRGWLQIEGYSIFKLFWYIYLTGGAPALSGKDSLAHILFIKRKLNDIYKKTYKFLEPKDYLNLKFTGKFLASYDSITLHWLTDNRNISKVKYNNRLLRYVQIDRNKLPELVPSSSIIGKILPEIARELELNQNIFITSGTPDLHSATIGSGAISDYDGHIYIGTSSWITCHVPFKKTDIFHNIATLPSAIPSRYFVANEQETSGYCLSYLRDSIFFPEDDFSVKKLDFDFYEMLNKIIEKVPAGSNGVIFTPWLAGERTPVENHTIRGGFYNLSLTTRREHLFRSIMEGVAFNSKWLLGYIEKFINRKFYSLNFIGGGAKSDIWSQILADILNKKILQVEDPLHANVRGVVFAGWVSMGKMNWEEIPKKIKIKNEYFPNNENQKIYNQMFKEFLNIYKKTKTIYRRLNGKRL